MHFDKGQNKKAIQILSSVFCLTLFIALSGNENRYSLIDTNSNVLLEHLITHTIEEIGIAETTEENTEEKEKQIPFTFDTIMVNAHSTAPSYTIT